MKGRSLTLLFVGALSMGLALPAIAAADCQADLDAIDANATSAAPITPEQMDEVMRLRNQGQAECDAGLVAEGLASLAQAKAILGIQ